MSKLFNIVNEGINSNDFNEAEQKLFGIEGININSEEYFKIIISSFIKKKEHIIRRENKNIIFDLNNYNDIWSIVFLGEYIKENNILYKEYNDLLIEIKIENLEKEINNTIKEHRQVNNNQEKALIDQEHKLIDQKISVLKDELKILRDQMKNYKSLIDTFNNFQQAQKEIVLATGATGDALRDLTNSMLDVQGSVGQSQQEIAQAIGELNTRLGLTGDELTDFTTKYLNFASVTGQDGKQAIADNVRLFNIWGVAADKQAEYLDKLAKAGQLT